MIARLLNALIDWLRQERINAHCQAAKDSLKAGQKQLAQEHMEAVRLEQALMSAERRQHVAREQLEALKRVEGKRHA